MYKYLPYTVMYRLCVETPPVPRRPSALESPANLSFYRRSLARAPSYTPVIEL